MKNRAWQITALAAAFLLGSALSLPAEERQKVKLQPHFSITGWHSDNIEFSTGSEISDYYAEISPGIGLTILTPLFDVSADYSYVRYQYSHYKDLNREFHRAAVEVGKDLKYEVLRDITLQFGDKYETVPINIERPSDEPENLTQRNRFYLLPLWTKNLSSRNILKAGYEFSRVDYTESGETGEDYWSHRFFTAWKGEVTQRLSLTQDNSYEIVDYDDLPTYTQFVPESGIELRPDQTITLAASAGYSFAETDEYNYRGNVYNLLATYQPSEKSLLRASYSRSRSTDIEGTPLTNESFELLARYHPLRKLSFEGYIRYVRYLLEDSETELLRYKFSAAYALAEGLALEAGYIRVETVDAPPEETARSNRFYAAARLSL